MKYKLEITINTKTDNVETDEILNNFLKDYLGIDDDIAEDIKEKITITKIEND